MVKKVRFRLLLCVYLFNAFVIAYPTLAEIKVFEKETTWKAAKNQSQEQAERLAVMEAQRQAIEEAGDIYFVFDRRKGFIDMSPVFSFDY